MRASYHVGLAAVLAATLLAPEAASAQQGSVERPFVSGGRVRLDLSAGDYTVKAGRDNRVLVTWTSTDPDDPGRASVTTDTKNRDATVVTQGKHGRFVIELPALSDLHVDVSAGDIRIQGITGSKDVGSWAGNVDIEVARPDDYGKVDVAVKAGDISALPFHVRKSGLLQSFSWKGPGRHTLRVRLTAGDLRLLEAPPPGKEPS